MKQLKAKVLSNDKAAEGFYRMRLESAYLAKNTKPGQFVEVRCSEDTDPLLRRPFSAHRILENGLELLYEVVGKGTELLSGKKAGDSLDVIGPMGKGFDLRTTNDERLPAEASQGQSVQAKAGRNTQYAIRNTILIAGGIGVAPLVALAEKLVYRVERIAYREKKKDVLVFIGAKTKSHILCENDFKKLGCRVVVSTEDGSKGQKGLITDTLRTFLYAIRYPLNANLYACGPTGMLKAVAAIARSRRIPCQVSLEERMACGVGVCLGCPVRVRRLAGLPVNQLKPANRPTGEPANRITGKPANYYYKMVCKDGPVFDAEELVW